MLKCDDFIGCFGSCENEIPTDIVSDFTGELLIESEFNGVKKSFKGNAVEGQEIKIENNFTPGALHRVLLKKIDNTKIKAISFKIYSQCL
ncbi:hypothetical protein EGI16_03405 [Chryseobacterium sp. G0240]|uniref:hypothetical protein n=1 Tax=Chryseobacterium sp. G0240 TaxID=2487066 RepID=UPI000F44A17F|nr:hypothetical protein [Chryseobacterium sp. G0240]ROI05446.1 hypothetical protein EGI16_03405 [Chryseobacterium sp. G0240]